MVWLVVHMPGHSAVLAVIILTLVVKFILAPLSYKALQSQVAQKKLQPEMERIRAEYPNRQEQSQKMMELYKTHKTNPFSGCLVMIIQMPIIFALYYVFYRGLHFNEDALYGALQLPEHINQFFLGIDISEKNTFFAIAAGISQAAQLWLSPAMASDKKETTAVEDPNKKSATGLSAQLGSTMQKQMKYMMPILIVFIGLKLPAAVAVYWIVNNIFTLVQEMILRARLARG